MAKTPLQKADLDPNDRAIAPASSWDVGRIAVVAEVKLVSAANAGSRTETSGTLMNVARGERGATLDALDTRLPETNFSRDVLNARPSVLAVLPVFGVQRSDWGEPSRVLATLANLHARPCRREPVSVDMSGSTVEDQSASCD